MMVIKPPQYPLPPRFMFETDEAYLSARNEWLRVKRRRDEEYKIFLAVHIVAGALFLAGILGGLGFLIWQMFGLEGIVGAILTVGVFWAAVSRVKTWL